MARRTLLVMALALENHQQHLDTLVDEVIYTGVGKVNAALTLSRHLARLDEMPLVINAGSAGSHSLTTGTVACITDFVQHDMDASAIGCKPGQTPFEDALALHNGQAIAGLAHACCYTGDSFVTTAHPYFRLEVIDMEAYALAKVCQAFHAPFLCLKYITDGADGAAAEDWQHSVVRSAHALHDALQSALPLLLCHPPE